MKRKVLLLTIIGLVLFQNSFFAMKGYCSQPAEAGGNVEVVEVEESKEAEEGKKQKKAKKQKESKETVDTNRRAGKSLFMMLTRFNFNRLHWLYKQRLIC